MNTKLLMVVLGVVIGGTAQAAGPQVPKVFQANTPARAAEVNENFQNLADRIQDVTDDVQGLTSDVQDVKSDIQGLTDSIAGLPGGILLNASDFSQPAETTSKTFKITGGFCTDSVRTYASPTAGTIVETVVDSQNGSPCGHSINTYEIDETGARLTETTFINPIGGTVDNVLTYTPAFLFLPAQVSQGMSWTVETVLANTNANPTSIFLAEYTVIGLESVTVPAGEFHNCLKTSRVTTNSTNPIRIDWRCPGVGLVKHVEASSNGINELTSITPPLQ